jgi:hypothetical protein
MPTFTDIDQKSFKCKVHKLFHITGSGFTKDVIVKLEETGHGRYREWIPSSGTWRSNASSAGAADGTVIEISAKPQRKDGRDCVDRTIGDLTVTVTNTGADTASVTSTPIEVNYNA